MPTKRGKSTRAPSSGPAEIAPGVFVGGWKEAVAFDGRRFCVLDEAPDDMPTATHVRIFDEATESADVAALDRVAKGVAEARRAGSPVLIFCGRGAMRSPLAGMWYLHRSEGLPLDAAYERVHAQRPKAVHPREWVGNVDRLLGD